MTLADGLDERRGAGRSVWCGVSLVLLCTGACGPVSSGANGEGDGARPGADGEPSGRVEGEAPVCLEGEGFRSAGELLSSADADSDGTEAANVGAFRWERHGEACERFVVDLLGSDGEPAEAVGTAGVELLRELGVVRIHLPDLRPDVVVETDATFDGPLARAAFAVRTEGRRLHVDLHLGEPATARAFLLRSPARVAVDLRAGGGPLPPPAPRSRRAVVLQPRGPEATYPLEITGYARTFEANVLARIRQGGALAAESFTTAHDWAGTWGAFRIVIEDGPTGEVELFVGEESARDGTEEGLRLDLRMR